MEDSVIDVGDEDVTARASYKWEGEFKRVWEDQEDGLAALEQKWKRRRQRLAGNFRRSIIRHLYLVVDCSLSMLEKDLMPNRLALTKASCEGFITDFFDQNPISQMGTIAMKNRIAQKLTELSSDPLEHIRAIKNLTADDEPSLQNALEVIKESFKHVPRHGSREALIVYGSLSTNDPGDIFETIKALQKENVRCSVIGLTAEMRVCRMLANATGGTYNVILEENHFRDLLNEHILPPIEKSQATSESVLVTMGFPKQCDERTYSLCVCHEKPILYGCVCPRCGSRLCEPPIDCPVCSLSLVSSPHLARSYHHLFPLAEFKEVSLRDRRDCLGCQKPVQEDKEGRYECPLCHGQYCAECEVFVHEVLHNCVGCCQRR